MYKNRIFAPRVGFTDDINSKITGKRYNVTLLELNDPVASRDDVDRRRRRESSVSTSTGANDVLQSLCSECHFDRSDRSRTINPFVSSTHI